MKILFLALDVNVSGSAGDAVHVRCKAKAFADAGHEVLLLAGAGQADIPGVAVEILRKRFRGPLRVVDDLAAIRRGAAFLRGAPEGLIYERRFSCKVGMGIRALTRHPLFVEINGLVEDEAAAQGRRVRSRAVQTLRHADRIIAVAPKLGQVLAERHGLDTAKVKAVSNGVDSSVFFPRDRARARKELGLDRFGHIVLFVGNLVEWYDFETLLAGFARFARENDDAALVLLGEGALRGAIEAQARELDIAGRLILTGRVDHARVPEYIAASTICTAPFTWEVNATIDLSPMKLFEYAACARPVVSTHLGGMDRYQKDYPALFLSQVADPADLHAKLVQASGFEGNSDLADAAAAFAKAYGWDQAVASILEEVQVDVAA